MGITQLVVLSVRYGQLEQTPKKSEQTEKRLKTEVGVN